MPTISVRDLHVLAVCVTDLARSEAFYREHLGFAKLQDMEPGILLKPGQVMLYLEGGREAAQSAPSAAAVISPCFGTDGVTGSFEALKAAGVRISTEYQEFGPTFAFFGISNAGGILIEVAGTPWA